MRIFAVGAVSEEGVQRHGCHHGSADSRASAVRPRPARRRDFLGVSARSILRHVLDVRFVYVCVLYMNHVASVTDFPVYVIGHS